jgi:hypothetical protein
MNREVNVDINDGLGEGFRSLLRQIVPDAAGDVAMLVPADVLLGIDARVSMRCAVRVAFQRDCRTSDGWKCRDLLLQFIVFSLAGLQAQIPAVVGERDTHEIRIFKRVAECSNVSSSNVHFGEACGQMNRLKSLVYLAYPA